MTSEAKTFFENWPARMRQLNQDAPEIPRAFGSLFNSLMKQGALSVREKELIALGIGLAMRCVPCISAHAEKAMKAGASRQQIIEAAGVAVMMQGGPTFTYVPHVLEALDALTSEAEATQIKSEPHIVHNSAD